MEEMEELAIGLLFRLGYDGSTDDTQNPYTMSREELFSVMRELGYSWSEERKEWVRSV